MTRRLCWRTLALAGAAWLSPLGAHADTCSGLVTAPLTAAPVGTNPSALAAGDFNRDGKLDLAVVNTATNDVSILLGDGLGGFTTAATSPIALGAASPIDIAVGDLDHDGFADLVVAFGTTPQVQVLRGQPGATFVNAGLMTLGPTPFLNPTRILLGRLTSDAKLDLVVLYDAGQRIRIYAGAGLGFVATPTTDLSTPGETMTGGTLVDFNRDGRLDLAVAIRNKDTVRVYLGDGTGGLATLPALSAPVGTAPVDVAAGDVDRDGWPDLVSADSGAGTASVLQNKTQGTSLGSAGSVSVGSVPIRVALTDLDHNGLLDLSVLDDAGATPLLTSFGGQKTAPFFDPLAFGTALDASSAPRGLVIGAFSADGRDDFATAYSNLRQAVVIEDRSGMPCPRASFAAAPRAYPAGDGPVSTAAADFDHDGRTDLVVASANDKSLRILQNAGGTFSAGTTITGLSPAPRSVTVADMNVDGNMDVVVAQGAPGSGLVQVYLGNGAGGLVLSSSQSAGDNLSAVVVGDVNGDGAPDVIAASEGSGRVFVFLGNGLGLIGPGTPIPVGSGPHALVAADLDGNGTLDLAVANSLSNNVTILFGKGDGTFTPGPVLNVGTSPVGIAAADLDGDGRLDLVTADNGSSTVSVILRTGTGGFVLPAVAYTVGTGPMAVALLNLDGDAKPDIAVTSAGSEALQLLTNNGSGGFAAPQDYTVRTSPQAITPIDADSDGLVDLAIPCRSADAVVILINRPPPPVLQSAPRVAVHKAPRAAVSGDFDANGTLDLAVANSAADSISLLSGDGLGGFTEYQTLAVTDPEAIVAGDWNGDGRLDLAVSSQSAGRVAIFFGSTTTPGKFDPQPQIGVGSTPDDLVAGDFDGDGDLDLAVCDKVAAGSVSILRNNGAGAFSVGQTIAVGKSPTAIVAADFDRDGDLDLAVANDDDNNVVILRNGAGDFTTAQTLALGGSDTSPVSLAVGDFDGDGTLDLVAAAGDNDHLHLYRNLGPSFATTPIQFDVPYVVRFVTTSDLNLDGKPDLLAVADGLSFFRGKGALAFDTPQTVVARHMPAAAVVADFNRDGRPDVVVVDEGSGEISILLSTACQQQRLEVSVQPAACSVGAPPYGFNAAATAYDEGGNLAVCASGSVSPAIVPGTGDATAVLGGPASRTFSSGIADFSGANGLTLDKAGRYKLQFTTPGLPLVQTKFFTIATSASLQILGPSSVCAGSFGLYTLNQSFDTYAWTRTPPGPPAFAYTPAVQLSGPPLAGSYQLDVLGRNECAVSASRSIFFGDLASVSLSTLGVSSVCVDCIGGTGKAIEVGGGVVSHQWGYRTTSGGPVTPLTGETADSYALKGASFPGPGNYFVVVTSQPTCGPTLVSNEWPVTVVANVPTGEVQHLAASSRGTSASGESQLLWVNATGSAEEIRIRWNQAPAGTSSCLPPANISASFDGEAVITTPSGGMKDDYLHSSVLIDTAYCYSVFVKVAGVWSAGRTVKARAFDATTRAGHSVKWAYATGGTAVAPPTVSGPGILAMSNDRTVHALTRGSAGGLWPAPWVPTELTGVAHSRSPVVPFTVPLAGADTVLFTADDATPGFLHAIDARTGVRPWPAQSQGLAMTGAPGGLFTQYGGVKDLLFVGTRDSSVNNQLRALKLADGSLDAAYTGAGSPGPIGPINGTPAIDYATGRLYFASWSRTGGDTLFCLEIKASPTFTYKWSRNLGNISGSPVLRGGRIYVGTDAGLVYSLDAASGGGDHTVVTANGPVKGFLFPDRRNDNLIFATDTKVWSVADGASAMSVNWTWTIAGLNPSLILYWPQTSFVYVGSVQGALYELDFSAATLTTPPTFKQQVLGDGLGQVGAPSLDIGVSPKLLIVGSEPGVIYGVEVPFP